MSKRNAALLAAVLVWGINKLLIFCGSTHFLAPSYVWSISVALMAIAGWLTTDAMTKNSKVVQGILGALVAVGSILIQFAPDPTPVPTAIVQPAQTPALALTPALTATISPVAGPSVTVTLENAPTALPASVESKPAIQAEVVTPITTDARTMTAEPRLQVPATLFPGAPVPKVKHTFLILLAVVAGLALAGCCGAQSKADAEWYKDSTCWQYTQLTVGSKSDPFGERYHQEQLDRRLKLVKERMDRKNINCDGLTY